MHREGQSQHHCVSERSVLAQKTRCGTGDASQVWRYFESVPEEMSTMRTLEAAAAADRHLRYTSLHPLTLCKLGCEASPYDTGGHNGVQAFLALSLYAAGLQPDPFALGALT